MSRSRSSQSAAKAANTQQQQQQHQQEQQEQLPIAFWRRSLDRNDAELAALDEIHARLRDMQQTLQEQSPMVLLFVGRGKLLYVQQQFPQKLPGDQAITPELPSSLPSDCLVPIDDESRRLWDSTTPTIKEMALQFASHMCLRRRLLNRLARRLLRVGHSLDKMAYLEPPATPKYGDLRLHVDAQAVASHAEVKRVQFEWKKQVQIWQDEHSTAAPKNLAGVTSSSIPTAQTSGNPTAQPFASVTADSTTSADPLPMISSSAPENPTSLGPGMVQATTSPFLEYKDTFEKRVKVVDKGTLSVMEYTQWPSLQNAKEDYERLPMGALGIGSGVAGNAAQTLRTMPERQAEFQRYQSALWSKLPVQPKVPLQGHVFSYKARKDKIRDDKAAAAAAAKAAAVSNALENVQTPKAEDDDESESHEDVEMADVTATKDEADEDEDEEEGDEEEIENDDDGTEEEDEDETAEMEEDDKAGKKEDESQEEAGDTDKSNETDDESQEDEGETASENEDGDEEEAAELNGKPNGEEDETDETGEAMSEKEKDEDEKDETGGEAMNEKEKDEDKEEEEARKETGEVKSEKEKDEDSANVDEEENKETEKDDEDDRNPFTILKRPISLQPCPSFYEQDMKRIKLIHSELMATSMRDHMCRRVEEVTKEYNEALRVSNELFERRQATQAQLRQMEQEHRAYLTQMRNDYQVKLAVARNNWNQRRREFENRKLNHLMPSRRNPQHFPQGTQYVQRYAMTYAADPRRREVAKCLGEVVDTSIQIGQGMLRNEKFNEEFYPPHIPDDGALHKKRMEDSVNNEISVLTTKLRESEEERQKAWKRMLKTKAEFEVPHQHMRTKIDVNMNNYQMMPLPSLRSSTQQQLPKEFVGQVQSTFASYIPPQSPSRNLPTLLQSSDQIAQRLASDGGTLTSLREPRRTKEGLYKRPAGRTRRGMRWDAIRGIWIPTGES